MSGARWSLRSWPRGPLVVMWRQAGWARDSLSTFPLMALHLDAVVVRGGTVRDVATLKTKVEEAIEDGDGPVISVFCDVTRTDTEAMDLHELCAESDVVHTKVQVTTVSRRSASNQDAREILSVPQVGMPAKRAGSAGLDPDAFADVG